MIIYIDVYSHIHLSLSVYIYIYTQIRIHIYIYDICICIHACMHGSMHPPCIHPSLPTYLHARVDDILLGSICSQRCISCFHSYFRVSLRSVQGQECFRFTRAWFRLSVESFSFIWFLFKTLLRIVFMDLGFALVGSGLV